MPMNLLSGEYECKLDPKGRLVLPAKVKSNLPEQSGNQLVLVRGFEPCLVLYPRAAWRVIHEKVMASRRKLLLWAWATAAKFGTPAATTSF